MENRKSIVLETISGVKTKNIDVKSLKIFFSGKLMVKTNNF